jgi:hypothetical protein
MKLPGFLKAQSGCNIIATFGGFSYACTLGGSLRICAFFRGVLV